MMDRRRDLVIDQTGVVEKWGVPPGSIPDYLALVGDTADGIPGIPRWGAKSSATVLSHYGTIEHIPAEAVDWNIQVRGAQGLASSLSASREAAALYKMLATLRTDVPLESALDDLRWRGARRELLEPLCHELGDAQLVERVPVWDE